MLSVIEVTLEYKTRSEDWDSGLELTADKANWLQ